MRRHVTCTISTNNLTLELATSEGNIVLSPMPVTCATFAPLSSGSVTFTIALTLDTGSGANAFAADTYTSAPLTVTVDAP